jgi:hypothetical protein
VRVHEIPNKIEVDVARSNDGGVTAAPMNRDDSPGGDEATPKKPKF